MASTDDRRRAPFIAAHRNMTDPSGPVRYRLLLRTCLASRALRKRIACHRRRDLLQRQQHQNFAAALRQSFERFPDDRAGAMDELIPHLHRV